MDDQQTPDPTDRLTDRPDDGPPERIAHLLGAAFLLGLIVSLVVMLGYQVVNGDDDPAPSSLAVADTTPSASGEVDAPWGTDETEEAGSTPAAPTRLSRCAEGSRGLEDVLADAQPALDQWAIHVGAMNKLVLGEITLQQATAFWDRTRVAARRHVEDFRGAATALRRTGVDCPAPALLAPGARALPGCVRRVAAEVHALGTARTSIDTWDHHIRDMERLRSGELTPEEATAMWLSMWQEGMRDLDAHDAAAAAVEHQGACTPGAAGE